MGKTNHKIAADIAQEKEFSKMMNWPRRFLAIQTAVSAAGDDFDRVLQIVLENSMRLVPAADGGEVELRDAHEFVCRAVVGSSPKTAGSRSPVAGIVPGFCSISEVGREGLQASITAPIPFRGESVGLLRLHSRRQGSFNNRDLLALQLLAGLVTQGLAREAHAQGEHARAEADRRFRATFEQAAVGIAHVSPNGDFILVNDKFCEIAGHERDALIEGGFQKITHPEDLDVDLAHIEDLIWGRSDSYSMEKRYIRRDGSAVWVNLTVSLIRKPHGAPDYFVSVIEDISARRAAEIDAERDPLTGLLNRRGALRRLEYLLGRDGPWQLGFAAAFIDLNGFKQVNDGFGHSEGDRCLTKVAAALRKALRSDDMIARMGGDEFLALFPAASEEAAREVVERLQQGMKGVSLSEPWAIGASYGVAMVPEGVILDPVALIGAADELMYRAKHSKNEGPLIATVPLAA